MDAAAAEEFKKTSPVKDWGFDGGELLKTGDNVVKVFRKLNHPSLVLYADPW